MTAACLSVGALALQLATGTFTLEWTHSVEHTAWRETWQVEPGQVEPGQGGPGRGGLRLLRAAVKGSGAGMDPGEGARLEAGWWVWTPDLRPLSAIELAASGATGAGWRLCADGTCREIGAHPGAPIRLAPCAGAGG